MGETEHTKIVKTEDKFPIQTPDLQFEEAYKLACGGVIIESVARACTGPSSIRGMCQSM
jgi:hypothetical protein